MNIQGLRKRKTDFNSKIWSDYQALRKSLHERIETSIAELKTEQRRLDKTFIKAAINNAGEKELSDNLILDRVQYGEAEQKWIVMPESHGIVPPPIQNFHAIAMLRNPDYFKDDPQYKKSLLVIASVAMKTEPPQADKTLLRDLEAEWDEVDEFKLELKNKNMEIVLDEQMIINRDEWERLTRGYNRPKEEPMTQRQAQKIMEGYQVGGNHNLGMNSEEMKRHSLLQAGIPLEEINSMTDKDMVHFGASGAEIIRGGV